ncbi:MAG: quinolinate synthase NadA [Thermoplasmata archaeon]
MRTELIEEIRKKISALKKEKNAIILAHNYQLPEVQEIADFQGDSFELSRIAASSSADMIVFCGVDFMAESAKILSPSKKVLLPEREATCPMAQMVSAEAIKEYRKNHPDIEAVVAYINTTAEVKAVADVCCTSSSAVRIVKKISAKKILFVPDTNLGRWVASQVPEKVIELWPGFCPTHQNLIKVDDVLRLKKQHPRAKVIAHPECSEEVIAIADAVLSTSQMIAYAKDSKDDEFIVATESGMAYALEKKVLQKKFYPVEDAICPNMKKTNLLSVLHALKDEEYEIILKGEIIEKARIPLERMLAF